MINKIFRTTIKLEKNLLCVSKYIYNTYFKQCTDAYSFLALYFEKNMPGTYYTESKKHQCDKNKRRSFGDLYNLLKTYFKNITVEELCFYLLKLIYIKKIKQNYCDYVDNLVFRNQDFSWRYWGTGRTIIHELCDLGVYNEINIHKQIKSDIVMEDVDSRLGKQQVSMVMIVNVGLQYAKENNISFTNLK
jgi:hypothetical protein